MFCPHVLRRRFAEVHLFLSTYLFGLARILVKDKERNGYLFEKPRWSREGFESVENLVVHGSKMTKFLIPVPIINSSTINKNIHKFLLYLQDIYKVT